LEWGRTGEGLGRGRSVYEQPGAKVDEIAPHKERDSKVSKRGSERESKGSQQGE
jgi:hypothetical protein